MTRILVIGKSGQVARALAKTMPEGLNARFASRKTVDLAKPATIALAIDQFEPEAVIIAAAYTAVDAAETDSVTAWQVNSFAPGEIGRIGASRGFPVIHISTDYVFDGRGDMPFAETDACGPINVYGASKLAGELALANSGAQSVILRTSWVYDDCGQNFLTTMRKLRDRPSLDIVADQFGRPTHADEIARSIWKILPTIRTTDLAGVFHLTGGGPFTTWHEFAAHIFGGNGPQLNPVSTDQFPRPARRPANSRLNTEKLQSQLSISMADWRETLAKIIYRLER
ncbi:MAG: dTDP-4-dehydrorhamnose reductase [Paracoccaceae bacterium]